MQKSIFRRYVTRLGILTLAAATAACGDSNEPSPGEVPATVSVSPAELTVEASKTASLQATVSNASGNAIPDARVSWSTSSATTATVSQTGVVTGVGAGVARITATIGTISGSALTAVSTAVTTPQSVGPAGGTVSTPGGEVKVTLPNGTLPSGGTVTITPVTTGNPQGTTVPGTVYKIGVFGIATGPRPTITVRYSTAGLPAGFDERKLVLSRKVGVFWIPLPTVVDVTAKTMTATIPAGFIGSASLTSLSLGRAVDAADEETIVGATLYAFEASAASLQLTVGDQSRVTGRVASLTSGSAASISSPTASSSAPGVVAIAAAPTINGTDVSVDIRAVAPGTAAITLGASTGSGANAAPFAGVVNVTVVSQASLALTITGLPAGVNAGVTVTGPGGFSQTATASRTFTGIAAGTYTIAAQSVSASGITYNPSPASQSVTVAASQAATASVAYSAPAACASVDVSPLPINLVPGQSTQLTVVPRDANGNALTGRTVTFSSSNTSVMTVNSTGLVSGVGSGQATLTVRCESATNQFPVSVGPVPVASVVVTPASFKAFIGDTIQLSAVARDAAGNVLTGRLITWTTSNANAATVAAGAVISRSPGNVTISAISEGRVGTSAGLLGCFISGSPVTCGTLNIAVQTPGATVTGQRSVVNGYGHLRCLFNITFIPTGGDAGTWINDVPNWTWDGLEIRSGVNIPGYVDFYQDWQVNGQPAYPAFQINLTWRYQINSSGQIRSVSMPTVTCQ